MLKIKFSHEYFKLKGINGVTGKTAELLQVLMVRVEDLTPFFIAYDTDNGKYKLPEKGEFLLLIFKKESGEIFTTLRSNKPGKWKYYSLAQGQKFRIIINN